MTKVEKEIVKKTAVKTAEKSSEKLSTSFLSGAETESAVSTYFRNDLGQFTEGNPGQPKRYETRETLQDAIIRYFEFCEGQKKHLTMTGLAIALGFRSRSALVNYEKEEGYEFAFDVITYAKMRIEEYTEQKLHDRQANIIGAIFSLKNNWGWADKSEIKMDSRTLQFNGFEIEGLNDEKIIDIKQD